MCLRLSDRAGPRRDSGMAEQYLAQCGGFAAPFKRYALSNESFTRRQ